MNNDVALVSGILLILISVILIVAGRKKLITKDDLSAGANIVTIATPIAALLGLILVLWSTSQPPDSPTPTPVLETTVSPPRTIDETPNPSTSIQTTFFQLNLREYSWFDEPTSNLGIQPGLQEFEGIPFDFGWRITTSCGHLPELPEQINLDVAIDKPEKIYFLMQHSIDFNEFERKQIGNIKLVFNGATDLNIPLVAGENVRDWVLNRDGAADVIHATPSAPNWQQVWESSVQDFQEEDAYDILGYTDMLTIEIPEDRQSSTLDRIEIFDTQNAFSNPCLNFLAITVEQIDPIDPLNITQLANFETERLSGVAWSPESDQIATVGFDGKIRIWNLALNQQIRILGEHIEGTAKGLAWSADGKYIASGGEDETVRIWDLKSGNQIRALSVSSVPNMLLWSPNGQYLASANKDGKVLIWNTSTWELLFTLNHISGVLSISWAPNSEQLVSGDQSGNVNLWEMETGRKITTTHTGHEFNAQGQNDVRSVSWSPDGRFIASGASDDTIRLWDITNKEEFLVWRHRNITDGYDGKMIDSLGWSPNGKYLAEVGWEGILRIRLAGSGTIIAEEEAHTDAIYGVLWSPDGSKLATVGSDGLLRIWGNE